jgi:hypothetical protein
MTWERHFEKRRAMAESLFRPTMGRKGKTTDSQGSTEVKLLLC